MKAKNFLSKIFCFPLALMMGIPDSGGGTGGSQNGSSETSQELSRGFAKKNKNILII